MKLEKVREGKVIVDRDRCLHSIYFNLRVEFVGKFWP